MQNYTKTGVNIVKNLQDAGFIAYFAGGWVRDYIMNQPSDDIDIVSSASIKQIQLLFKKTIPVGVAFGIVVVVVDGYHFEVATFRKDIGYCDGRHPSSIEMASPEEDAKRRDFTINGLFYDPLTNKIHDFVGGIEDIKHKIIRAIGNPIERFEEDRLRMIRAIRYATRFNFVIEEQTLQALCKLSSTLRSSVSIERIYQEFKKMIQFKHFAQSLRLLYQVKLLSAIFPEVNLFSAQQINDKINLIEKLPLKTPLFIQIIEIFPECDEQLTLKLAKSLKLPQKESRWAVVYIRTKKLCFSPNDESLSWSRYQWTYFYAQPDIFLILEIINILLPDNYGKNFLSKHYNRFSDLAFEVERIQNRQPLVKAHHLIEEGIKPSKKLGILLKEAEKIAINDHLDNPKQVIDVLKKSSHW